METMLTRKIVRIDEGKCNGCGLCVPSCAEGAIRIIDGKARLLADNLCDGLGNCLGECPQGAISIQERPAEEFDEDAVRRHQAEAGPAAAPAPMHAGCPGAMMRQLQAACSSAPRPADASDAPPAGESRLEHWPVQLALLPPTGSLWQDADVLIAADCVGFAMSDFHERLLAGRKLAVACPKLDDVEPYVEKLTAVFAHNTVRSVTVAHMEVPCCWGIVAVVREALLRAGSPDIPVTDITVGVDGRVVRRTANDECRMKND